MAPFFSGEAFANKNLDDSRQLEGLQGAGSSFQQSKKEIPNMFERQKQNIHGNYFGKGMGDTNRYVGSQTRKNELPFQQQRVRKIDERDPLTRQVGKMIADKSQIDNIRTLNNPKLTFEGRVKSGAGPQQRGKVGSVGKYKPSKFYLNTADRYFTTVGGNERESNRPTQVLKKTDRGKQRDYLQGPAKFQTAKNPNRTLTRKSAKITFKTAAKMRFSKGQIIFLPI
jgi:hypothetical protein